MNIFFLLFNNRSDFQFTECLFTHLDKNMKSYVKLFLFSHSFEYKRMKFGLIFLKLNRLMDFLSRGEIALGCPYRLCFFNKKEDIFCTNRMSFIGYLFECYYYSCYIYYYPLLLL